MLVAAEADAKAPGATERWTVVEILDFNSDRKRMSVIVQRADDADARGHASHDRCLRIFTKGADTVMEPRLAPSAFKAATFAHMARFSREGLRTLIIATAELENAPFREWLGRYREAAASLDEIQKREAHRPNRIDDLMDEVERAFGAGLELLGATAIEDRLQDGVPETIHDLARAGVKIWVSRRLLLAWAI